MDFKMSIILHLIPQVTNFNYTLEIKLKITLDDTKLQHVFANDQVLILTHYENLPMQYTDKFFSIKIENFIKNVR